MNDAEKKDRCLATPRIYRGEFGRDLCVVYGRKVGCCADCAFSTLSRPCLAVYGWA